MYPGILALRDKANCGFVRATPLGMHSLLRTAAQNRHCNLQARLRRGMLACLGGRNGCVQRARRRFILAGKPHQKARISQPNRLNSPPIVENHHKLGMVLPDGIDPLRVDGVVAEVQREAATVVSPTRWPRHIPWTTLPNGLARHQWKGRPQSPDAVATLPQLAATASRFLRFRVSGAAPVRRLSRNKPSEKAGTIQAGQPVGEQVRRIVQRQFAG